MRAAGEQPLGRRERKKLRTRDSIVEAAIALFDEQGFEETTVAEIADAADVAVSTFFTHFPSKFDVFFTDHDAYFDALSSTIENRPAGEDTFDAIARFYEEHVIDPGYFDDFRVRRRRLIDRTEVILAEERFRISEAVRPGLRASLARDLGIDPSEPRVSFLVGATIGVLLTLNWQISHAGDDDAIGPPPPDRQRELVEEALRGLRAALAALREAG